MAGLKGHAGARAGSGRRAGLTGARPRLEGAPARSGRDRAAGHWGSGPQMARRAAAGQPRAKRGRPAWWRWYERAPAESGGGRTAGGGQRPVPAGGG
jgi:hypothetical protein